MIYTFELIERSRRKLVTLGVFDKVHFSKEDDIGITDGDFQPVVVKLSLRESLRGAISLGPVITLKEVFLYSRITYSNIFSKAHKIQLGG